MRNKTKFVVATGALVTLVGIEYYMLVKKAFNLVFKMQNKVMLPDDHSNDEPTLAMKWFNDSQVYDAWITSDDGLQLNAIKVINHPDSQKWAVLIHGYDASYTDVFDQAYEFDKHDFNILFINNRGFGISDGEFTTMGYKESDDVLKWLDYIKTSHRQAKFVLYGVSLGASIVMMTLGKDSLSDVLCAIEDCGYSTLIGELNHMSLKYMKMPLACIKYPLDKMCENRLGFIMEDVNCMNALSVNQVPVMFIHGEDDNTVPFEMVFDNYYSNLGVKELFTVSGAAHNQCKYNPEYYNRIFNFVKRFE